MKYLAPGLFVVAALLVGWFSAHSERERWDLVALAGMALVMAVVLLLVPDDGPAPPDGPRGIALAEKAQDEDDGQTLRVRRPG